MRYAPLVATLAVAMLVIAGCGGSSKESESALEGLSKQAEDLAEDAGGMIDEAKEAVPADLQGTIDELKKEIAEKEAEAGKLAEQLKGLSPSDLTGDKAKELQAKSKDLQKQITDLKAKLDGYLEKVG